MKSCKAIESRWNKNCTSLSSEEIDAILWPKLFRNSTADSLIIIIIIIIIIIGAAVAAFVVVVVLTNYC